MRAGSEVTFEWLLVDPAPQEGLAAVVDFLGFAELITPVAEGTELLT